MSAESWVLVMYYCLYLSLLVKVWRMEQRLNSLDLRISRIEEARK